MTDSIENIDSQKSEEEFGKCSWIKPALVMGAIGASISGVILAAPYILETIQVIFLFMMFFGLLG